jgi:hypothetical protein
MGDERNMAEMKTPHVFVVCAPCGHRGHFAVARLLAQHGDASMPGLLPELTRCPKWKSLSTYDYCKAVYGRQGG